MNWKLSYQDYSTLEWMYEPFLLVGLSYGDPINHKFKPSLDLYLKCDNYIQQNNPVMCCKSRSFIEWNYNSLYHNSLYIVNASLGKGSIIFPLQKIEIQSDHHPYYLLCCNIMLWECYMTPSTHHLTPIGMTWHSARVS